MKTLVIVHLEPDFSQFIPPSLVNHIFGYSNFFDKVIVVESASELSNTQPYDLIVHMLDTRGNAVQKTWVWGLDTQWIPDEWVENEDYIYCQRSRHSGAVIYDWMNELPKGDKYYLVGGHRRECLESVSEIFDALELNYKVVESLTYGN